MEKNNEEERTILIILHSNSDECPVVHFYGKENFVRIPFAEFRPHFWCFQLENVKPTDSSFEICVTPTVGPSKLIDLNFSSTQPFVFYDLSVENGLVPFIQFCDFFTQSIQTHFLPFSFDIQSPVDSMQRFLASFDDNYFIWSLAFISTEPWSAIFKYNEELSKMLMNFVPQFIARNFIPQEVDTSVPSDQYAYFCLPADISEVTPHTPLHPTQRYKSLGQYADVLMLMVRQQLGDAFAYMLSVVIDFNQEFPFTSFVPTFNSKRDIYVKEVENVFAQLIERISTIYGDDKQQQTLRVLYTAIAVYNEKFTISLSQLISQTDLDFALVDLIIKIRMYESDGVFPAALRALYNQLPLSDGKNNVEMASGDAIVPPEWLNCFFSIFGVSQESRNTIAEGSIKLSVPKHIADCFFDVTESGAIVMSDEIKAVLQPGCITHQHTTIPESSMMMSGAIAVENSVLKENSFVPSDAVLLAQDKLIDDTALIDTPVSVGRGSLIRQNAVVCKNVKIGRGAIINEGSYIGKGAYLGHACVIEKGEIVPPEFSVPYGFRFSRSVVEQCTKIPNVITLRGTRFIKQASSFDIEKLVTIENTDMDYLLKGYFEMMKHFPNETGKQIATHANELKSTENTAKIIVSIYENNLLSMALSYWNNIKEVSEEWNKVIISACNMVISQFSLEFSDFEKCGTAEFLLMLSQNLGIFMEKGVDSVLLEHLKKNIFELCDELLIRMSLVSTIKVPKLTECLSKIIDLTKPNNSKEN